MTSHEIRKAFLSYFEKREHRVVPSSPLVLPDDPTLLFANAGMNQFKDVFTGRDHRDYVRATSSQKCLRVSGKHNDLEMVGRTPRHHTFFEMLGNFSFGDYFKTEAIEFAWELITVELGLPAERLWVTVFEGAEGLEPDEEALTIWRDRIGVDPARILRLGEKDNFWRMGDTGPCGPCSEIHFDLGPELTSVAGASTPETDERRYLEIWNLVFMEFDQQSDGTLPRLPAPSIDTGMGLERMASVLQGRASNYDTDVFKGILEAIAERAGRRYGEDDEKDFSMRVIADHTRAFCCLVADGVVPSNARRGYVLRRLLRRAIRHAGKLGIDEPFLHEITPVVLAELGGVYPELLAAKDALFSIGQREERRFAETLTTGLSLLDRSLAELPAAGKNETAPVLSGKELFRLYDTFGFPLDLARDVAEERGIRLDEDGFEREMRLQRERAQSSWKGERRQESPGAYGDLAEKHPSSFEGYERTSLDGTKVTALLSDGRPVDTILEGSEGDVLLEATPFYAESGGQVADTGLLHLAEGRAEVLGVRRPQPGLILHRVRVDAGRLHVGDTARAEVNEPRRLAIRRNHTATHLLHAALREVVGTHVKQAGSLVAPDRLRFDFSHFAPIGDRALADIESLIQRKVLEDLPIEVETMDRERALKRGAMALFGEKYGERVRVVRIGDFSLELCGGTHTGHTGEIGLVKVTQERGVASGTRRIEAISGEGSLAGFQQAHDLLKALEEDLAVPRERLAEELARRLDQARSLQRELDKQRMAATRRELVGEADNAEQVDGVKVLARRLSGLGPQEMRQLADNLRQKLGSGVVILGRTDGDKASLLVAVTDDLKAKIPAGDVVKKLARIIGGGGGGRSDLAEAGGKNVGRLDEALAAGPQVVRERMEADA